MALATYCECCGVKYEKTGLNALWVSTSSSASHLAGHICFYCAGNIPQVIVEMACGFPPTTASYTWNALNCWQHPDLKRRLEDVKKMATYSQFNTYGYIIPAEPEKFTRQIGSKVCPRCDEVLVEKTSESLFGNKYSVLKCKNCGYCD